jgi:dynein heavy chain
MKKAVRRTANKQKMQSLEWTDEAIEEFSNIDLNAQKISHNHENEVVNDDMESKIARVQMRKKEAEAREARNKARPALPIRPESVLTHYSSESKGKDVQNLPLGSKLADSLNEYYRDYARENPTVVTAYEANFPLEYYDSSIYDEVLPIRAHVLPMQGSCLIPNRDPEASPVERGVGLWHPCKVLSVDDFDGLVTVEISSLVLDETQRLPRVQVCLVSQDVELYSTRVTEAMLRRQQCVALLKYYSFIHSMPVNELVTSTMTQEQFDKIYVRAASMKKLLALDGNVAGGEIETARREFEVVMNKIMFDANMLSGTNARFFRELRLPSCALTRFPPAPRCGLMPVPSHPMKTRVTHHKAHSFFHSMAAITSLQASLTENSAVHDINVVKVEYNRSFTLEKFERYMQEQMMLSVRRIKQEWPQRTGTAIRNCIAKAQENPAEVQGVFYDIAVRNVYEFDKSTNPIKGFLERVNFMMCDELFHVVKTNLLTYADMVEQFCGCEVTVQDVRNIVVNMAENSIYKTRVLPPLFSVAFRIAAEDQVLNKPELKKYEEDMVAWKKTKEFENGDKCPIPVVKQIVGRTFEYSHSVEEFKSALLKVFRVMLQEFLDVPHVQKFVMDRIYFPNPKFVSSVTAELPWVVDANRRMEEAIDRAVAPLRVYLKFFKKYEDFVNIDRATYIASKINVAQKDPESQEIELPVSVNLEQVISLVNAHLVQIREVEDSLPVTPIECGLFLVEVVSVRHLLLDKHRTIIRNILTDQADRCALAVQYLEDEFKKINRNLSKRPENVEQLVELEEYVGGLPSTLNVLQGCIQDMMGQFEVLDQYKHKVEFDVGTQQWSVFGAPAKIAAKCVEVAEANLITKRKFRDEMLTEQGVFTKAMQELDHQVASLEAYHDLNDVVLIASRVKEVEVQLVAAQAQVKLFGSREALFEQDATDYEELNRIQKNFEPYSNLWQTSKEWLEISERWLNGRFVDLDAETVERLVDKFSVTINKAAKYFTKANLEHQSAIANKIKTQVMDLSPEVPMIVTLRNPGMRDRHWEKIANQLKVDIMPIENFTTAQIIALNLKDSLELIQKIGESAAKEYQIEKALDKMEKEWEEMNLQLHPYRETGTAVLKGVDDINTILDEQITMTQTIMFSAFKGPFEERIEEWNRKLCCVSDVLEVWVTVQRNWLYLQPIFESPDINRQLPAEGKKFATVDKSWRQTISAAKAKPKVIEFCDNAKLLERFRESELLLDQVQKGLSDYLETKRSVFARFYFLSNDELLSILSESKDVKLVQPHLKKCFEGIDKVKFLGDLSIDRIISPENEEIMLTSKIDPVDKNVEVWMLELEGMMRVSIRDVMGRAIADYTKTPRPRWMQKWAGMCVLNGSQMHWTSEMEQLFLEEGVRGPVTMLQRQVAQLADMTVLVRGHLSSAARVTVGALTVIDVHARDVIKKLVDDNVETKDNFGWTSQLRYYWDGTELTAQMVAATRPYGYEYLGNTFRLVITPLTDKCYLTLMGALQMIFGGAPAGPAGTGKTETTKGEHFTVRGNTSLVYNIIQLLYCRSGESACDAVRGVQLLGRSGLHRHGQVLQGPGRLRRLGVLRRVQPHQHRGAERDRSADYVYPDGHSCQGAAHVLRRLRDQRLRALRRVHHDEPRLCGTQRAARQSAGTVPPRGDDGPRLRADRRNHVLRLWLRVRP